MALGGFSLILIASTLNILLCGTAESHHLDLLKNRPKSTNLQTENGNSSSNTDGNVQNGGTTQQKPRLKTISQWSQSETKQNSFTQIGGKQGKKQIAQESNQVNEHFKLMSSTGSGNNGNRMRPSSFQLSNDIQQHQNSKMNGLSQFGQSSQTSQPFGNLVPTQRQGNIPKHSQIGLNTITSNSNPMNTRSFGTQPNPGNIQNQPQFGLNAILPGSNQASVQPIGSQSNQMTSQNSNRQQQINQGQLMQQQGQGNQVMLGSQVMSGMQPQVNNQLMAQRAQNNQPLTNQMTSQQQQQQLQQQQIKQRRSGSPITTEQQAQQLISQLLTQSGPTASQTTRNKQPMLGAPSGPFVSKQQNNPSPGVLSPNQLMSSLNQLSKEQLIQLSQVLGLPQNNALNTNTNIPPKNQFQTNSAPQRPQFSFTGQNTNMRPSMNVPLANQNNQNLGNIRQNMFGKMSPTQNNMKTGNTRQNMLGKINTNARQNMLGKITTQQNTLNIGNILGKISPSFSINNPTKTGKTTNATENSEGKSKEPQTAQIRVSIKRKTKVTPAKKETPVRYIIPGNIKSTQSSSRGMLGSPLSGQNFQQQQQQEPFNTIVNGMPSTSSSMFSNQQPQNFNSINNNRFPIVKLPTPDFSSMLGGESPSFKPNMLLADALDSLPLDVLRGTATDPLLASLTGTTGGTTQTKVTGNTGLSNNIKIITNPGSSTSTSTSASGSPGTQDKMSLTLLPSHPGARPIVIKSAGNVLVSQYKDAKGQTQYVIKTQTKTTTTLGPSAEEAGEYEAEEMTSTTQSTTGSVAG